MRPLFGASRVSRRACLILSMLRTASSVIGAVARMDCSNWETALMRCWRLGIRPQIGEMCDFSRHPSRSCPMSRADVLMSSESHCLHGAVSAYEPPRLEDRENGLKRPPSIAHCASASAVVLNGPWREWLCRAVHQPDPDPPAFARTPRAWPLGTCIDVSNQTAGNEMLNMAEH